MYSYLCLSVNRSVCSSQVKKLNSYPCNHFWCPQFVMAHWLPTRGLQINCHINCKHRKKGGLQRVSHSTQGNTEISSSTGSLGKQLFSAHLWTVLLWCHIFCCGPCSRYAVLVFLFCFCLFVCFCSERGFYALWNLAIEPTTKNKNKKEREKRVCGVGCSVSLYDSFHYVA